MTVQLVEHVFSMVNRASGRGRVLVRPPLVSGPEGTRRIERRQLASTKVPLLC